MKIYPFLVLIPLVFLSGCLWDAVDLGKAKVEFRHTILMPGGFSVESSVPINLSLLNSGKKDPGRFWEGDVFAIEASITNDNVLRENTRVRFGYDPLHLSAIQLYRNDGSPFKLIEGGIYEFSKEILPSAKNPVYVVGKTAEIKENYEYVPIEFKLDYLNEDNQVLSSEKYSIQVGNRDYSPPMSDTSKPS